MKKNIPALALAALTGAFLSAGCRPPRAVIAPLPSVLSEIEGYASLQVTIRGEAARARFSFVIVLSRRAKVEVQGFLGGTAAEIYIDGGDSYFVLRSDRVYWKASTDEVLEKFLGSRLGLQEMAGLLCGQWKGESEEDKNLFAEWIFKEDAEGRKVFGGKENFEFTVREFFPGSPVPRRLDFQSFDFRGSLRIRAMAFNKPIADNLFAMNFLSGFSSKSWEELEKILRHED